MQQPYLKYALRSLLRDKKTSFLHLLGLSLGMAGCLLLLQFVWHERSYDGFHPNSNQLYRVAVDLYRNGELNLQSALNYNQTGPLLVRDFAEVETCLRLFGGESTITINGSERYREEVAYFADSTFFTMFGFPLVQGNALSALRLPNTAAISRSHAIRFFGTTDCVGRTFEAHNWLPQRAFTVSAVFEDFPQNTHLEGGIFFSFATLDARAGLIPDWAWRDFYTYVKLRPGIEAATFEAKISDPHFLDKYHDGFRQRNITNRLYLQPVSDIYLQSDLSHEILNGGDAKSLGYLTLIGIFILFMAWVNYINLATARAFERARDVGVRKTIGAGRWALGKQFLTEAFLLNGVALAVALCMVEIMHPILELLTGKELLSLHSHGAEVSLGIPGLLLIGSVVSGLYPSWLISGFKPIQAMRQSFSTDSNLTNNLLRKSLIVIQFTVSISLIISTLTVNQQVQHMKNADLGMDITQTLVVRAPVPADSVVYSRFEVFKEKLLAVPAVKAVTASHVVPGDESHWTMGIRRYGEDAAQSTNIIAHANAIEPDFLQQYELKLLYGRNFSKDNPSDAHAVLLTEKACQRLGIQHPETVLGQRFIAYGDTLTAVGVTADFRHFGMQREPEPYIFLQSPVEHRKYSLKVSTNDLPQTIELVKNTYEETFPQAVFEYVFADELFDRQYRSDQLLGRIFFAFAALAILIACIGLFGLTAYMVAKRQKEIGIRKVLGATTFNLLGLLSANFLKLVLIGLCFATPMSWYLMKSWLEGFAYRIDIQWTVFALAGVLSVGVAFLTVSFQSVKAALANPVKSLRNE